MPIVARYRQPHEAHLARAHLEGNGIAAFVRDEHLVSIDWRLSDAVGGVKVEVAEEDYAAAKALLAAPNAPAPSPSDGKKRRDFSRYLKIFLGCFAICAGIALWRGGLSVAAGMQVIMAIMLSAGVAAFCAVLDL